MSQKVTKVEVSHSDGKLVVLFVALVIFGTLGVAINEIGADTISLKTLDKVCVQLYGNGTIYNETVTGTSRQFVCIKEPIPEPQLPEPPRVRLE